MAAVAELLLTWTLPLFDSMSEGRRSFVAMSLKR